MKMSDSDKRLIVIVLERLGCTDVEKYHGMHIGAAQKLAGIADIDISALSESAQWDLVEDNFTKSMKKQVKE